MQPDPSEISAIERFVLNTTLKGVFFTHDRIVRWASQRLGEILGQPTEELIGTDLRKFFPTGADYESFVKLASEGLEKNTRVETRVSLRRRNGNMFPARIIGNALTDESGSLGSVWLLEDITRQQEAEAKLSQMTTLHDLALEHIPQGVAVVRNRTIQWANRRAAEMMGFHASELLGQPMRIVFPDEETWTALGKCYEQMATGQKAEVTLRMKRGEELWYWCRFVGQYFDAASPEKGSLWTLEDVTETREMEIQLRSAQKLESVGRLASGIAHEINTPIQFVSDSVQFVREAMDDVGTVLDAYSALKDTVLAGGPAMEAAQAAASAEEAADLGFIRENLRKALERAAEGLGRVSEIVRSMKEFAHPDQKEMAPADLNRAVSTTLMVSRNEYKYVSDITTELGDLPAVICHAGEINEVLLNIVVNAAQAISDRVKGTDQRGRIRVRTWQDGAYAAIDISDTGGGIPEGNRDRIFDPFFTTKEVGRGTGQGLAIARNIIVDKHKGALSFDVDPGVGTTFHIRLPLRGPDPQMQAAA
jgi:PAS domain S-box-containing protein